MVQNIINTQLISGDENMTFSEFQQLANSGETFLVERKSLKILGDKNLKEKIGKLVSAFSNNSGGCVLIGINDNGEIKCEKFELKTKLKTSITDHLADIVNGACSPSIADFSVKKIKNKNETFYAIFIAKSDSPPHQARDGKFYYRKDKSNEILDGQQIIDILNRTKHTDLIVIPNIVKATSQHPSIDYKLELIAHNSSLVPAKEVLVIVKLETRILHVNSQQLEFRKKLVYPEVDTLLRNATDLNFRIQDKTTCKVSISVVAENMRLKTLNFIISVNGHNKPLITDIIDN